MANTWMQQLCFALLLRLVIKAHAYSVPCSGRGSPRCFHHSQPTAYCGNKVASTSVEPAGETDSITANLYRILQNETPLPTASTKIEAAFMQPKFYNSAAPVTIHDKHLPHWRQDGVLYFVTSRLADSMPQDKLLQWQESRNSWLKSHSLCEVGQVKQLPDAEQHEFHRLFTSLWHQWLDNGYGKCWLRDPNHRELLIQAFVKNHGATYDLDFWVVMPNHFHALLATRAGTSLGEVLKQWKGGSAREINRAVGRTGTLWQAEPYDHIVRSQHQMQHYRRYIANNPILANLPPSNYSVGVGADVCTSANALLDSIKGDLTLTEPASKTESPTNSNFIPQV